MIYVFTNFIYQVQEGHIFDQETPQGKLVNVSHTVTPWQPFLDHAPKAGLDLSLHLQWKQQTSHPITNKYKNLGKTQTKPDIPAGYSDPVSSITGHLQVEVTHAHQHLGHLSDFKYLKIKNYVDNLVFVF